MRKWRDRWIYYWPLFNYFKDKSIKPSQFNKILLKILDDCSRTGRLVQFSPEQIVNLLILACENPELSGLAISHWSARELAIESIKREFFESISERTVSRILKTFDLKPHKIQYWLNSPEEFTPEFTERVNLICGLYESAQALSEIGVNIISTDEKTGIQAIQRLAETIPMKPGMKERLEQNYKRHETTSLIASMNIATGKILSPHIGPTRTEMDFLNHIKEVLKEDTGQNWVFIMDQLNTHQSESLVRYIAEKCQIEEDLGKKQRSGILKSKKTRSTFLEDPSHRIRIVFTPKHTSWMNQIEIWFSILVRKLLKRLNVSSVFELRGRLFDFIEYYNEIMAKPFKWIYKGIPCTI